MAASRLSTERGVVRQTGSMARAARRRTASTSGARRLVPSRRDEEEAGHQVVEPYRRTGRMVVSAALRVMLGEVPRTVLLRACKAPAAERALALALETCSLKVRRRSNQMPNHLMAEVEGAGKTRKSG